MTTIDLSHLTITDQLELLYTQGIFLSKRKLHNRAVLLYQFRTVYAEIYYLEYRKRVERIVYSHDVGILDPYLEQISLDIN